MHQKIKIRGTTGYDDSYLEFLFRYFKEFTPHTIILDVDAVGAVRAHSGEGPDYR